MPHSKAVWKGNHDYKGPRNTWQKARQKKKAAKKKAQRKIEPVADPRHVNRKSFPCQLAHGSPTGFVSNFSSPRQFFREIANYFDFPEDSLLFCTVNTHRIEMDRLFSGQLQWDDFIFAHVKGQRKQIEVHKTENALGMIIADNGVGKSFLKRVTPGSIAARLSPALDVGDHIESINDKSMVGKRHFEVVKELRCIPTGTTFSMRLVEPYQQGFSQIAPRSSGTATHQPKVSCGMKTLRFKSSGETVIEEPTEKALLDRLSVVFEAYLGISDEELVLAIWELGRDSTNPVSFADKIQEDSSVAILQLPDAVVCELWGVIRDWQKKNDETR